MQTNNEYLRLVQKARQEQLKLYSSSYEYIRDLYKQAAKDLAKRAQNATKGSLSERWLTDYVKSIKEELKSVNGLIKNHIKDSMSKSAGNAAATQLDFFNMIESKPTAEIINSFRSMFSKVPKKALQELISGDFYKDGRGLSERIWFNQRIVNGQLDYIMQQGLLQKKSAYDLAKDFETYVNPEAKKDWEWKKVYPNAGNRTIDYNAQRLARTSINHAYFLSNVRSCKANPFAEAIHWELSQSHYSRQVARFGQDICDQHANHDEGLGRGNFEAKKVPVPHPQCLCIQYAVIPDSLEDIAGRLRDWVDGKEDTVLDNWYNKYGSEFSGMQQKPEEISLKRVENAKKRDKKINITDVAINKVPCIEIPGFTKEQNLVLQQKHQELLKIAKEKNNSNEVLNMLTDELDKNVITLGNETGVNPGRNPEAIALMRRSKENSVIWIHNHPKTSTFSYGDIGSFLLQDQIKAITIVTNTGEVHALSKLENFNFDAIYDIIEDIKEKHGGLNKDTSDAIAKEALKRMEEFGVKVTYRGGKNGK